jgi:protocatechuate 3,4-dioxygenase beta subunit
VGLLQTLREFGRRARRAGSVKLLTSGPETSTRYRAVRIERMEPRILLAADFDPLRIGAVYYEDASGIDEAGDVVEITYQGGAPGTQLVELVIETDKLGDGLTIGDVFFDTDPSGLGAFGAIDLSILSQDGIQSIDHTVDDGGTALVFKFTGFDPGDRLLFTIDVDEQGFLGPNAVAEGNEVEGSRLTAVFKADHFFEATGGDIFLDHYDAKLSQSGLGLPPDDYVPPNQHATPIRTAGAIFAVEQTPLPITIAGTVYEDFNLDNDQDAGEPGIAGVDLQLFALRGNKYLPTGQTAVTSLDGNYLFENVLPGTYRIVEIQPEGYYSVGAAAGTVDGITRGVVAGPDVISDIPLLGGQDSVGNDFAEARPASLGGYVYHDADNDGVLDPGESGIRDVSVRIQYLPPLGPAPAAIEVITQADGSWLAEGLMPGDYSVVEVQPPGYLDGLDAPGTAGGVAHNPGDSMTGIRLESGQAGRRYNFGELIPSSIGGRVIADRNGNCRYDPGESLLAGVTIHLLDASGTVLDTTLTDNLGEYVFTGLAPGVYGVREIQPEGYFDGSDHVGSAGGALLAPDSVIDIHLVSGTTAVGYDFCEILPSTISGRVIADANGNQQYDAGETPIAGVTIHLLDQSGTVLGSTKTDTDGFYAFMNLPPGVYGVREVQPDGYYDGADHVGSVGGQLVPPDSIVGVRLISGTEAENYDFLEILPSTISGRVIADANGNQQYDAGETPIGGVTIHLLDQSGTVLGSTKTDTDGFYAFMNLPPGVYGVREVQPDGYYDGADHVGSVGGELVPPDSIVGVRLISGTEAQNYDFLEILPSSIRGRILVDGNGNGKVDVGENSLAGVTLELLDDSGKVLALTQTDVNGNYAFTNLAPGVYGVREIQPDGYYDGADHVGSVGGKRVPPDTLIGIQLVSGTLADRYDFLELEPVSLSGFVYVDDNDNGVRNHDEVGIAGVQLKLLDAHSNPTGATTVTGPNGFYVFDGLKPLETYGVAEVQPEGFYDGLDAAGTAGGVAHNPGDSITDVLLLAATSAKNYNFGELRPASIHGRVHLDTNSNCTLDPGEPPLADVTVYLLDATGKRVASTTTDSTGQYAFGHLRPGVYGVEEITPDGLFDGADHVGSAGGRLAGTDSIVDVPLGSGTDAVEYNFCERGPAILSGYVFQDGPALGVFYGEAVPDTATVRDGRFTADDVPIAGVVLQLGDASGAPILDYDGHPIVTLTDQNGYYEFTGLEPGVYTILETQPEGYLDGIDTPGSEGGFAVNPHDPPEPAFLQQLRVDPNDDAIILIPLDPGDEAVSYNFSEVLVIEIPPYIPPPRKTPTPEEPEPPIFDPPAAPFIPPPPPPAPPPAEAPTGSGAIPLTYTWHLSVVNAGTPRRAEGGLQRVADASKSYFNPASWSGSDLQDGQFVLADGDGVAMQELFFGLEGATPVAGDFNGDGIAEIGVYLNGVWFIDLNGNGIWDDEDLWARLGNVDDFPVVGDWDGDGKTDIGIFGPAWEGDVRAIQAEPGLPDAENEPSGRYKNIPPEPDEATDGWRTMQRTAEGNIRADVIDHVFQYGTESDVPVAGDWNGDGIANIGLFREGTWYLDEDGSGKWSPGDTLVERFGALGDIPVVGDFNGDGVDDLGIYRGGYWRLDTNGNRRLDAQDRVFELGGPDDRPVVADFNGDGIDEIGIYRDRPEPPPAQAARPQTVEPGGVIRR